MEQLYNPDLMSEQEIKQTFVARQGLIDELVTLIEQQPEGAGIQHAVIIAPRGMGKTTALLMVGFALKDRGLSSRWQAVRFREESYGVYDLADFWIETINLLALEVHDPTLQQHAERLQQQHRNNDALQEAALALIKDWCRQHNKRLVLLVDNFDLILEQINAEQENAQLRNVLMNDGTMVLIGGATTFFHEARAYDQPLYNFFKIVHLNRLSFEEMQDLLRQRAALDGQAHFEETLRANTTRLRVLEYFTDGNPRLVLMLYRIITKSEVMEVWRGLEELLDQVTPYYKAKIESLPPQQRKILDHIARISSQTHEGLTPTEIAHAARLTPSAVSSQLKRLVELGYVRCANLRGRNSYYTLSEPLYAIWHQMRFGRVARQRMQWLIDFLKSWYDADELGLESRRLETRFLELFQAGSMDEARDTLLYRRYLAEAMGDTSRQNSEIEGIIRGYLDLEEFTTLVEDVLPTTDLAYLSTETLTALVSAGCLDRKYADQIQTSATRHVDVHMEANTVIRLGWDALRAGRVEEALLYTRHALELGPDLANAYILSACSLVSLMRYEEAIASLDRAVEYGGDNVFTFLLFGSVLLGLDKYRESIVNFDQALAIKPDIAAAWYGRGIGLAELGRYAEAVASFEHELALTPDDTSVWRLQGLMLSKLGRYEEAVSSFDRVLELNSHDTEIWHWRGVALGDLDNFKEAVASFDRALEINPGDSEAWTLRGVALSNLKHYDDALESLDHALETAPKNSQLWFFRDPQGQFAVIYLMKLAIEIIKGRLEQASNSWRKALEIEAKPDEWYSTARTILVSAAQKGHSEFVRNLIASSDMDEVFFPLARALDYLRTGDEALIEKLSPEVRKIVEENVARLKPKTGEMQIEDGKKRAVRAKPEGGRRSAKRLS